VSSTRPGVLAEIARARAEFQCNTLAAEVVAAARSEGAVVRLTPANAESRLHEVLTAAGVATGVWEVVPADGGARFEDR